MSGRAIFLIVVSAVMAVVVFTAVVRPGVERGGVGEIAALGVIVVAVLLAERWLRGR
jgi:hypothetical protein